MIATNADKIIAARMKGMRPADMVIVSLEDHLKTNNPVVYAKDNIAYDWRWVRGLDICVYIKDSNNWAPMVKAIAQQMPEYLCVWNFSAEWGAQVVLILADGDLDRHRRHWRYDIDFRIWMDFQNSDFKTCRTYGRDENGIPYAIDQ